MITIIDEIIGNLVIFLTIFSGLKYYKILSNYIFKNHILIPIKIIFIVKRIKKQYENYMETLLYSHYY